MFCRKKNKAVTVRGAVAVLLCLCMLAAPAFAETGELDVINLPSPHLQSDSSLEQILLQRRSHRSYKDKPLELEVLGQLLWAAQGITSPKGFRTAPSAGALYPLELYVVVGNVTDLPPGLYHYDVKEHALSLLQEGDLRKELSVAAMGQPWVRDGAAVIVFTAIYKRTTKKYGKRGKQYVHMEVGHVAENIFLQATALGLGTVMVGGIREKDVRDVLSLDRKTVPQALMPVGYPAPEDANKEH